MSDTNREKEMPTPDNVKAKPDAETAPKKDDSTDKGGSCGC